MHDRPLRRGFAPAAFGFGPRQRDDLGAPDVHLELAAFDKNPAPHDLAGFGDPAQGAAAQLEIHRGLPERIRAGPAADVMVGRRAAGNQENPDVFTGRTGLIPIAPAQIVERGGHGLAQRRVHAVGEESVEPGAFVDFVEMNDGPAGTDQLAGGVPDRRPVGRIQRALDQVGSGPEILQAFSGDLPIRGLKQLTNLGVDVRLNKKVEAISEAGVTLTGGEKIGAKTVVWAAGNAASPLGASLGVPLDRQGRVIVQEDCSIPGHPEVFVIGDQAHFATGEGRALPGLSPVAMQQGRHVVKNIMALLRGEATTRFEYHDKGIMATIGRHAAVAEMGSIRMSGFVAWLAWLFIHIIFLVGFRNRFAVLFNWAYAYVTYGRGARLITRRHSGSGAVAEPPKQ